MRAASRHLIFCIIVIFVFFPGSQGWGQDLVVMWTFVDDTPGSHACAAPFGEITFKGNGDMALSPGERVRVGMDLFNFSGYTVTSLHGIISNDHGYVQHINPNCALGSIGVRWSVPLANDDVAQNIDPFVFNVSQDAECKEFLDFKLTLYYYTDFGSCSSQECQQEYLFTLPVFNLNKSFTAGEEAVLFPSTSAQKLLFGASDNGSLGFFWDQASFLYYGLLDLDGNLLQDPTNLGADAPTIPYGVIWNGHSEIYEVYYSDSSGVQFMDSAGLGGTVHFSTDVGVINAFYNIDIDMIALLYDDSGTMTFSHIDASNHMIVENTFPGVGNINGSDNDEIRCDIDYLEPDWFTTDGLYYIAWETHSGATHSVEIAAYDESDLFSGPVYTDTIALSNSTPAAPSLAIDPYARRIAISYVVEEADFQREIYVKYYDEDLSAFYGPEAVTDTLAPYCCRSPELMFNGWSYYLAWFEDQFIAFRSSLVQVAEFWFQDADGANTGLIQQSQVSVSEWLSMDYISSMKGLNLCYFLWSDMRDSHPYPESLHGVIVRPLSPYMPYNVDYTDDFMVGQKYEQVMSPSLTSKGSEFLHAWWYHTRYEEPPTSGIWNDRDQILVSTYQADGTPIATDTVIYDSDMESGLHDNWIMSPIALTNGGSYEVYWRSPNDIMQWVEGEAPVSISPVTLVDTKLYDVVGDDFGGYCAVYIDQKPGDLERDLYAISGIGGPTNLTSAAAGNHVVDAAVAYNPGDPAVPWVVTWVQYNSGTSGFDLTMLLLEPDLTVHATIPISWTSLDYLSFRDVEVAANRDIISVLFTDWESGSENEFLMLYIFDMDGNYIGERIIDWTDEPYENTHLDWTGTEFLLSTLLKGAFDGEYVIYNFAYQLLDHYGYETYWAERIASPRIRMWPPPHYEFDFVMTTTDLGGAAVYNRDSETMTSNMFMTLLSWDDDVQECYLYNQPPIASSNGPYQVEFGSSVLLSGTASEDDLGDTVVQTGWDLTVSPDPLDRSIDQSQIGPSLDLTPSLQSQYGMWAPGSYDISFIAIDENGAGDDDDTTLILNDTTAPTVFVTSPNGRETLHEGDQVNVTWEGWDNFQIMEWDVYFCTDYGSGSETWQPIALDLNEEDRYVIWTVPNELSATCRIMVTGTDASLSANAGTDISDENFYIVQATTTAYRTLILTHIDRIEMYYAGESGDLWSKLTELASHTKVAGALLDLANVSVLSDPGGLYDVWDADPYNATKANDVANAIRDFIVDQVTNTYTNAEYIVLAGDDRIVPSYRVTDATVIYPESQYAAEVNCSSTVGSAICNDYYLTDNIFGDMHYETPLIGVSFLALPDLAVGRLIESPDEMEAVVNLFIAQDGQVDFSAEGVLVTGYDFLVDSATSIANDFTSAGKTVDSLIGSDWTTTDLDSAIFAPTPHMLHNLNDHTRHYSLGTPSGELDTTTMNNDHAGQPLLASLFYNVGCHSGLNVPDADFSSHNPLDLPQFMLSKGVAAWIGNTGFGWGLKYGIGYSEKLMEYITSKILSKQTVALGWALNEAKRTYYLEDHRYDVFDEKVLFESTLLGLPMYTLVVDTSKVVPPADLLKAEGPDYQEIDGIKMVKSLNSAQNTKDLPAGVTELTLNFDFGPLTYEEVTTVDGKYHTLNNVSGAEVGDVLQPMFLFDSGLSGTTSHGVLYTGGAFATESNYDPVVGVPLSNNSPGNEGPIGPAIGSFIPTINVTERRGTPSKAVTTELTRMTVYTGYFEGDHTVPGLETRFNQMGFVIYYSNSSDSTSPVITDPDPDPLHTLSGLTASFSVEVTDASGVYRVVIVYTDKQNQWKSFDLVYSSSSSRWEGSLGLKRDITYHVQAVDNAGNVGFLTKTGQDIDDSSQPIGSTYNSARFFAVTLVDDDSDGMPDAWETENGLNPTIDDAGEDPDLDGFTNSEEYWGDTDPQDPDSDGDGDNDGSESHNGRDPLAATDGKRISIMVSKINGDQDIQLDWLDTYGENAVIDGPFWIYRSVDRFFDATEALVTTPQPLTDGTTTYIDVGAGSGPDYWYNVTNVPYSGPAPVVDAVVPSVGVPEGGSAISIYGSNFGSQAIVTIAGNPAVSVVVVNDTKITCSTPPGSLGPADVTVTNLNGQFGTLEGGFTFQTP